MATWYQKAKEFQSPRRVVTATLLRSRETQRAANKRLREEIAELKERLRQQDGQVQRQQQEINRLKGQVADLKSQLAEARQSVNLPEDPPIGTHGYGARMIALAANLVPCF